MSNKVNFYNEYNIKAKIINFEIILVIINKIAINAFIIKITIPMLNRSNKKIRIKNY